MILGALYLILDFLAISFPLLRSWDKRLNYYQKWYALFPAIAIVDVIYIIWDVLFTKAGIWSFNPRYLVGWDIINLPVEEWLFFIFIPFSCIFIYEATLFYIKKRPLKKIARPLFAVMGVFLLIIGLLNLDKTYTSLTFILTACYLFVHLLFFKRDFLDRFIFGYLFSLIPFILFNGILTGSFIEDQIVWYNNDENLGIRLGTIPIEDSVYLLLYLLSITTIYEAILKRFPLIGIDNN
ncbi:lycopene cyclase domain-containing protein [Portibacter marinus]|uniref:lycopene cyclase domain-containing protein n=1 Tax=Portibacter marinus TaxID=2898660 RepID=UPI001F3673E4|nr:lycopene cyclase domain-containing protein [Portibacter marinus]